MARPRRRHPPVEPARARAVQRRAPGACATCARDPSSSSSATGNARADPRRPRASCTSTRSGRPATGRSGSCSTGTARSGRRTAMATSSIGRSRRCATTLEATGDLSILDDEVAYTDRHQAPTSRHGPIFAHTERQVDAIERGCIPGTALVVFAGGDWEDTLQPADPAMAERLVSSWTVELAYQTLGRYRGRLERAGRAAMARPAGRPVPRRMRADFNRLPRPRWRRRRAGDFRPGRSRATCFIRATGATGVRYRLIPMTRGIISGMFTPDQARSHVALVERHLSFPDGVRLMDRPMAYHGGTDHALQPGRVGRQSSGARSGCSTSTPTSATSRRWRGSAGRTRRFGR